MDNLDLLGTPVILVVCRHKTYHAFVDKYIPHAPIDGVAIPHANNLGCPGRLAPDNMENH